MGFELEATFRSDSEIQKAIYLGNLLQLLQIHQCTGTKVLHDDL
jgi:hypothetical protein